MEKRLAIKDHMKEGSGQGVKIIGWRCGGLAFVGRRAVPHCCRALDWFSNLLNEVIVCEHEIAARYDEIARAYIAMNEVITMEDIEPIAHHASPPKRKRFERNLLLFLHQEWEDAHEIPQRCSLYPRHQREHPIYFPFAGYLEDG
jgi:hypothetical protein